MSVPGQMVSGTFVVQPSDRGQEFLRIEAVVSGTEKRLSSHTIPAGGARHPQWLRQFAQMEAALQDWWIRWSVTAPPAAAGCSLKMAAEGSGLADPVQPFSWRSAGHSFPPPAWPMMWPACRQVVRRRDLLIAYPYTNTLTVLRITGAVLRQAMERSAAYFTRGEDNTRGSRIASEPKVEHYNYDYYAGVSYSYDISRPVGQRVVSLLVDGHPVADTDEFTICLNSYRASGTGGYGCYVGCPVVREIPHEMSELLLEYFRRHGGDIPLAASDYRVC